MLNQPWPPLLHLLVLLNRLALGSYLLMVGWAGVSLELSQGQGTFLYSQAFQSRVPGWAPEWLVMGFGYGLPWLAMVFGALLTVGLGGRAAGLVVTLTLLSVAVALAETGTFLPQHPVVVFVALALMLTVLGPGRYSLDRVLLAARTRRASASRSQQAAIAAGYA